MTKLNLNQFTPNQLFNSEEFILSLLEKTNNQQLIPIVKRIQDTKTIEEVKEIQKEISEKINAIRIFLNALNPDLKYDKPLLAFYVGMLTNTNTSQQNIIDFIRLLPDTQLFTITDLNEYFVNHTYQPTQPINEQNKAGDTEQSPEESVPDRSETTDNSRPTNDVTNQQ